MKKLVIDLGHGGSDPGAVGQNKTHEEDIVLAIGKILNELLKSYDLDFKFTRLSDRHISLNERAKLQMILKQITFYLFILIQVKTRVLGVLRFGNIQMKMIN